MVEPRLRFRRDDGSSYPNWSEHSIADLFDKVTTKNKDGANSNVITNSAEYGLIPQRDFFDKDIAVAGKTENYTVIDKGDFVYNPRKSSSAPMGPFNCYSYEERGIVSPLYSCLRPKGIADNDFLLWYFKTDKWFNYVETHGAQGGARHDRVGMTDKILMGIPVKVPCHEEQQKIADFLSSVDIVISACEKELEQVEELKKGLLQKMFPKKGETVPEIRFPGFTGDWEQRKFGELCSIVTKQTGFDYTATIKNSLLTEETEDTLPYLQTKNFAGVSINYNTDYYIPKVVAEKFPKINLDEKCLLFSIVGASVGNIGFFPGDKHCFLSGAICVSKLLNQDNAEYLYHYMCSECGQRQIRTCTKGGAQATITIEDIREFEVLLPSEDERKKIGAFLTSLDNTITLHQRELDKWKELKKGLLQQMFV